MSPESKEEERIRVAAEARRKFDSARVLVGQQRFQEALECYLFAFDNGELVDGWGGVRLSFIPGEIAELGKIYPQALVELRSRRDLREYRILNGDTEFHVIHEWSSLNHYLNDSKRELEVLNKLESEGRLDEDLKSFIMKNHVDDLMKSDDEAAILEYLNDEGRMLYLQIVRYELDLLFASVDERGKRFRELERRTLTEKGTKVFGMLLVASRHGDADEISKVLLELLPTKEMYAGLIFAALAAHSAERVASLWELAHAALSKEDIEWSEERISQVFTKS